MASYDPEFYEAPKSSPEYDATRPRQRGCFFYGCVIASVLAVLLIIALAVLAFLALRLFNGMVQEWTSPTPVELPRIEASEERRKDVKDRIDRFIAAVKEGKAAETLVLDSDDLNILIEQHEELRGTIHAEIVGDRIKARISIPFGVLEKIPQMSGRYLNGEGEVKASLRDGVLIATLDSLMINGKSPPPWLTQGLREQNLLKDAYRDPKNAELIRRFERLDIRDGKVYLEPRPPGKMAPTVEAESDSAEESDPSGAPAGPRKDAQDAGTAPPGGRP
ncbi:hypothetical protein [Aquisphaera insulae]|uniref:hypothetical protein n=1 Tax=Aquisphaera insulae TaxID=2712864 RepID=UPI0013EC76DF|nr:hypothetical protein [Aquisphaera insulae]